MSSASPQKRGNPFARNKSPSPAPVNPPPSGRPQSMTLQAQRSPTQASSHSRVESYSSLAGLVSPNNNNSISRYQSNSKSGTPNSNTFAPAFIKTAEVRHGPDVVKGIEGENDFSGKRYVWLKDPTAAFVRGWVVEEGGNRMLVQCDDGSVGALATCSRSLELTPYRNERSMLILLIKSTQPNLTRQMIWQSLHI